MSFLIILITFKVSSPLFVLWWITRWPFMRKLSSQWSHLKKKWWYLNVFSSLLVLWWINNLFFLIKLLSHWSHLYDFFSSCVFRCQTKVFLWKTFITPNTFKWFLSTVFSGVWQDQLLSKNCYHISVFPEYDFWWHARFPFMVKL